MGKGYVRKSKRELAAQAKANTQKEKKDITGVNSYKYVKSLGDGVMATSFLMTRKLMKYNSQ